MIQVRIKRVYEDFSETDGYRVLVDKLWPRGMKKEWLKYDYWAKERLFASDLFSWTTLFWAFFPTCHPSHHAHL